MRKPKLVRQMASQKKQRNASLIFFVLILLASLLIRGFFLAFWPALACLLVSLPLFAALHQKEINKLNTELKASQPGSTFNPH